MSTDWRALCAELADALDHNRQCLLDDRSLTHPLADKARAALAQPEPEVVEPSPSEQLVEQWVAEVWHEGTPVRVAASDLHLAAKAAEWGARCGRPAPAPVGEVAELVGCLHHLARADWLSDETANILTRAADPLERQAVTEESSATAPAPVAVSERPWEREGWCDEQGKCWMGDPGGGGFIPSWRLCRPEDAPRMRVSLPFNALPLPSVEAE